MLRKGNIAHITMPTTPAHNGVSSGSNRCMHATVMLGLLEYYRHMAAPYTLHARTLVPGCYACAVLSSCIYITSPAKAGSMCCSCCWHVVFSGVQNTHKLHFSLSNSALRCFVRLSALHSLLLKAALQAQACTCQLHSFPSNSALLCFFIYSALHSC